MRQLKDEPKPVYKVGFIRKKERVQLEHCSRAQKLVACCSGENWSFYVLTLGWGRGVLLGRAFQGLS
jgi:hypothetical protein